MFSVNGNRIKAFFKRIYYRYKSKTIKVPMFTVDYMIKKYGFENIDILQMDIQGAEALAIEGSMESIKKNMIDYIFIGTHVVPGKDMNEVIMRKLNDFYEIEVDIKPREIAHIEGFPPVEMHDGILLLKRKGA